MQSTFQYSSPGLSFTVFLIAASIMPPGIAPLSREPGHSPQTHKNKERQWRGNTLYNPALKRKLAIKFNKIEKEEKLYKSMYSHEVSHQFFCTVEPG